MRQTSALAALPLAILLLLLAPSLAAAGELAIGKPSLLPFSLVSAADVVAQASPVANWIHEGCWTPRSGSPCIDIYRDGTGQLWKCKACFKTGNPSPGKCSKTTQAELDRGLWCS